MGLFKADFFRSLALGFTAGAALVFVSVSDNPASVIANDVVPPAVAATAR